MSEELLEKIGAFALAVIICCVAVCVLAGTIACVYALARCMM